MWIAIALSGAGTFGMRASFLVFADRMATVPRAAQRILRQIPPAALASIVVPALLRQGGHFDIWQPRLAAGVVSAVIAWRTRNIGITLLGGMAMLMVLQAL
ncbi:MAG: hypothetical protein NVSMB16_01600 [Acidimicrobiales bacterium]